MNLIKLRTTIFIIVASLIVIIFLISNFLSDQNIIVNQNPADLEVTDGQNDFLAKISNILPYQGDGFYVDYPYYNIFTINYFGEEGKVNAEKWVTGLGIDTDTFTIKYVSEQMQENAENFIQSLPIEADGYFIYFSVRTNKLIIEYDNNQSLNKAKSLLEDNNISNDQFIITYIPR